MEILKELFDQAAILSAYLLEIQKIVPSEDVPWAKQKLQFMPKIYWDDYIQMIIYGFHFEEAFDTLKETYKF